MPGCVTTSDCEISRLVRDIDNDGIGMIADFLSTDELQDLQNFVEGAVANAGGEYVLLSKAQFAKTSLGKLGRSGNFVNLMQRVYEQGSGQSAPLDQGIYQTLRCLRGESGIKHSLRFHYDSYFLTALLPIIIPAEGEAGHLIMAPRRRPLRASYLRNLGDKFFLDNVIIQWLLQRAYKAGAKELREIKLVPGNIYFFWGYRTIHANAACDPRSIRATALFHFGDPHMNSRLRKFTGRAKDRAPSGIKPSLARES